MRSDKVYRAMAQGINHFEVCQLVSKGVRVSHKTGARFEDSINDVLDHLGTHSPQAEDMHTDAEIATATKMRPTA